MTCKVYHISNGDANTILCLRRNIDDYLPVSIVGNKAANNKATLLCQVHVCQAHDPHFF